MKTILRTKTREITINTDGPVIIIGESINPTRRKKLISTLLEGDFSYVIELAKIQIDAMADVLDVNIGFPDVDDVKLLPETVKQLQNKIDKIEQRKTSSTTFVKIRQALKRIVCFGFFLCCKKIYYFTFTYSTWYFLPIL